MKNTKNTLVLLMLCAAMCCIGCSKMVPVGGTVTFEDGTPLEVGTIIFTDGKYQGRSEIRPGGKFTIGMLSEADGLTRGEYKIYIVDAGTVAPSPKGGVWELYTPLIASKFTLPDKTPITVNIDTANRTLNIKVERATGADAKPVERMR
jgi:hypothetical protein